MFVDEAKHTVKIGLKRPETEQFGKHRKIVVALKSVQMPRRVLRLLQFHIHVVGHQSIGLNRRKRQRGGEHQAFE